MFSNKSKQYLTGNNKKNYGHKKYNIVHHYAVSGGYGHEYDGFDKGSKGEGYKVYKLSLIHI